MNVAKIECNCYLKLTIVLICIILILREWKEKVNLEDLEDEDAIYYNRKDTFIFKKEKSGPGLTGDEIVTIPHPVLVVSIFHQ